jgi:tetratricopeptide (TPR) repeat protein
MQPDFHLLIRSGPGETFLFSLCDAAGALAASHLVDLRALGASLRTGLADLPGYLRHNAPRERHADACVRIGTQIGNVILGRDVFDHLCAGSQTRRLCIDLSELPASPRREFSSIPWELARLSATSPTLAERNLLVQLLPERPNTSNQPLPVTDELRVLLVFAETPDAPQLAARAERNELLTLFRQEIASVGNVRVDVLPHLTDREELAEQIRWRGGYHVLHWSGHGDRSGLLLRDSRDRPDVLAGEELVTLFADECAGVPLLCFLSACHSGALTPIDTWQDFLAAAVAAPAVTESATVWQAHPAMANALLSGGVASVVAMRSVVSDDYAHALAIAFYRSLFGACGGDVAAALGQARSCAFAPSEPIHASVVDMAMPVLYGGASLPIVPPPPSADTRAARRRPRMMRVPELDIAAHPTFVGRRSELAQLAKEFLAEKGQPVAMITGLGGMGKSALVAEFLDLWEERFDAVLLYQAKPAGLELEVTLSDIHLRLTAASKKYSDHLRSFPEDSIFTPPGEHDGGAGRLARMTANLVRAMKAERLLLVLDNLDTQLVRQPGTGDAARWTCEDPAWTACLGALVTGLSGTGTRVLITTRREISLSNDRAPLLIRLGPLSAGEAALCMREIPTLRALCVSENASEREYVRRVVRASRFHPLLLDRLIQLLLNRPGTQAALQNALTTLERLGLFVPGLARIFVRHDSDAARQSAEMTYLTEALTASTERLIDELDAATRRLLWILAAAFEPVSLSLLQAVWSGQTLETQQLAALKSAFDQLAFLPPDKQAIFTGLSPDLKSAIGAASPPPPDPEFPVFLDRLNAFGLIRLWRDADRDCTEVACHELVREGIMARMEDGPSELLGRTLPGVHLAYAERLQFNADRQQFDDATEASEMGRRAIIYYIAAGALDTSEAFQFASKIVTGAEDPSFLATLLPHLYSAAESARPGKQGWRCQMLYSDALRKSGYVEASVVSYEKAEQSIRASLAGDDGNEETWADLSVTLGNCYFALMDLNRLTSARSKLEESLVTARRSRAPHSVIVRTELECLRLAVIQDDAGTAMPRIRALVEETGQHWESERQAPVRAGAEDLELVARSYLTALDVVRQCAVRLEDWPLALRMAETFIRVTQAMNRPIEDIARGRFGLANVLLRVRDAAALERARAELAVCLEVLADDADTAPKIYNSMAYLYNAEGDIEGALLQGRRALALSENLTNIGDRAMAHINLAKYLGEVDDEISSSEAAKHQLAAFIYSLVGEIHEEIDICVNNYEVDFIGSRDSGKAFAVPAVHDLLADPAFAPLRRWLAAEQIDIAELEDVVFQSLEQIGRDVLESFTDGVE